MLAGLPASPNESSEHKERVAAPFHQLCRVGVVSARFLRTPNARGILQRCKLFAWDLQWGPEATCLRSRLRMRRACRAKPAHGARLRPALAIFFGKANAVHGNAYLAVQRIAYGISQRREVERWEGNYRHPVRSLFHGFARYSYRGAGKT